MQDHVDIFDTLGDHKVYGRDAKSRQDGLFSAGGILGFCKSADVTDPYALKLVTDVVKFTNKQKRLAQVGKGCDG